MAFKSVFVHDQHEFSVEITGILNNQVELKIDGIAYTPLGRSTLWNNALFFEYIIPMYEHKRKVSIVLLKNRILDIRQAIVVVFEGNVLHGINSYQEYRTSYYKYTVFQNELIKHKLPYRILMLEWKKVIAYSILGVSVLLIFNMIRPLAFLLFEISVVLYFL